MDKIQKAIIKHWEKQNKWDPSNYLYYIETDSFGAKGSNDVDFALDNYRKGSKVFFSWQDYAAYADNKLK